MKMTCLNCKHEPNWGKEMGGEFPRKSGTCRYEDELTMLQLPTGWYISRSVITRYMRDDSGVHVDCNVWEPKED